MISRYLVALAIGFATPACAQPEPEPAGDVLTLARDSEARWIPFTLTPGNQIRFTMTLDGRPVGALLDTGVSDSLLARGSVAVRADRLTTGGTASAIGGTVPIEWMRTEELAIGPLVRRGGRLAVTPLPATATGGAEGVDVLVGRDLLAGYALDIDYPARRFRLLPSGRMPFTGAAAPLSVSRERRIYESAVTIGGRTLGPMVVDTGDGASVTVSAEEWKRAAPAGVPVTTALGFGLAGPLVTDLAILPHLGLGALTAREVEVRVEPENGFSTGIGVAGRIGSGLLGRYRVLLDPGAGRMVLAERPGPHRPPLRSTSGLLVGALRDRLKVLHVMRGGPAAAAGWKEGDLICAVNGAAIAPDYPTTPLAAWSAAPAGTVTRLTDCAGGVRTLVARDFY